MNELVKRLRGFEIDHKPEGWPGIRMKEVSAVLDIVEQQEADLAEDDALRTKLSTLLAETAVALKGKEAALSRHSWHDLPVIALEKMIIIEQQASKIAELEQNASLKERLGMAENRAEMLAEDIECLHMALDKACVPRIDGDDGPVFSMWGRVLRFKEMPSNDRQQQAGEIELHKEENKQLREQLHWLLAAKPNVAMVAENQALRAVAADMADALEHFGGDPIADDVLEKWKELNK